MKVFLLSALICVVSVSTVLAGFPLPKGVYPVSDLKGAKQKATDKVKGLAFIYSDSKTTCPLCSRASSDAIRIMKRKCVVVYAKSGQDWEKLPASVQKALRSAEAGRFIPKVVVTDGKADDVMAVVPYVRNASKHQNLLRKALRKVKSQTADSPSPATTSSTPEGFNLPKLKPLPTVK